MTFLGHVSFGVRELGRAVRFYDAALAPLGVARVWSNATGAGYGGSGARNERFAVFERGEAADPPGAGFHLAFDAPDRVSVDRFHAAAVAHGGEDCGAPGLRPHYGATYYAAFVRDPDGYKIEAVHQ